MKQHEHTFRVRYQETDAQGRVHHANYLTWFEMGRVELLRSGGYSYRDLERDGIMLVVADIRCEYFQPAIYDDLIRLITRTVAARGARIEHEYQVFRETTLLARGWSTVACIDREGRVRRLPECLRLPQPGS
jgi:acyl-CoA thioester hydrolase